MGFSLTGYPILFLSRAFIRNFGRAFNIAFLIVLCTAAPLLFIVRREVLLDHNLLASLLYRPAHLTYPNYVMPPTYSALDRMEGKVPP